MRFRVESASVNKFTGMTILSANELASSEQFVFKVTARDTNPSCKDIYGANAILLDKANGIFITVAHLDEGLRNPEYLIHLPHDQTVRTAISNKHLVNRPDDFRYLQLRDVDLSSYPQVMTQIPAPNVTTALKLVGWMPFGDSQKGHAPYQFKLDCFGFRHEGIYDRSISQSFKQRKFLFKLAAGETAYGMCGAALVDKQSNLLGIFYQSLKDLNYGLLTPDFKLDRYFVPKGSALVPRSQGSLLQRLFV